MIYGVLLTVLGLTDESEAEIDKAAGVNINLWAGLGHARLRRSASSPGRSLRPLGDELDEGEEPEPAAPPAASTRRRSPHSSAAAARGDGERAGGPDDARAQ